MKQILAITFILFLNLDVFSQTSDNQFQRPLREVLKEIETRFDVKLRISERDADGKMLTYANWRMRPDLETTLKNVLAPFDLVHLPDGAPNKFKIQGFQYHVRSVDEAKVTLDHMASKYKNQAEWEKRKNEMRPCILNALRLSPLLDSPGTAPILTPKRKFNGYTVENIALEILPGVYATGSIYKPEKFKGKIPIILNPNGHFPNGRYHEQIQTRAAALARMGAIALTYDLFAWGESALQFDGKYHRTSLANTMQALSSIRLLDYLLTLKEADATRVGITGGSGGGSHSMLISAIDGRISVSVPAVMMSAIHYGGCPCESGNPIHFCGEGTNNVELAAMFAPKPQLIISDGGDWTRNVPELEFPYLKRVYDFYGAPVGNVHLANEGHDYGPSKRAAMYRFMAKQLTLDETKVFNKNNELDETAITVEPAMP
jgi:hypothetical protein